MALTHRIEPGTRVELSKFDPQDDFGLTREEAEPRMQALGAELTDLQELLYAAGQHGLLIVLQGRDTAGKDGTIRHLLNSMNAQGTAIAPFKVPTPKEIAHDFLWRVHQVTPGRGESVIFNRSHYEDVLVVRVHDLAPKDVWSKRYEHINRFEKLLTDSNTIVLKFMLHISKDEQEERLLAREQDTEKAWKLAVRDWQEREFWDAYTEAYEDALSKCSTAHAPWHVVPANKKWFRNLAITETIVETLRPYRDDWMERLEGIGEKAKAELAAFRAGGEVMG
jgi:PPK2 family polyphosphate:nucleotide phosphotransferase